MRKISPATSPSKYKTESIRNVCDFHSNTFQARKNYIQSFTVIHPLLDRLLEIKMAKCLQHGQVRAYQSQNSQIQARGNKIEAPSISGAMKIISIRPKTSQIRLSFKPQFSRPRTTNTVIRSRTSQPRIQRKLELISKQPTQFEEQELKPSLFINKIRRSSAEPHLQAHH